MSSTLAYGSRDAAEGVASPGSSSAAASKKPRVWLILFSLSTLVAAWALASMRFASSTRLSRPVRTMQLR